MKKVILMAYVILGLVFVSQAQHTIGESYGGGTVFYVDSTGLHGLIAETQDQGKGSWDKASELIRDISNHSETGKAFTDWRLPDMDELNELFNNRAVIGGFEKDMYWSSSIKETGMNRYWGQRFVVGGQKGYGPKIARARVRAIRSF